MFLESNLPKELKPVVEEWNQEGKEYYLSPENMFLYNGHRIVYSGSQNIPDSGWFACNGNATKEYKLSKSEIETIQEKLLCYYKTTRWTIMLDWHCNYTCPMCPFHGEGIVDKKDYFVDRGGQKRVVSKEEAFEWIDKLFEYGIKTLSIMSLGEIILYPYWKDVSRYAHNKGMDLWTITNGSMWTEELVKEVASLGYTNIRVSLDALTFETYAKIRSNKRNYFDAAMKLPELLMKYGINTNVHFVKQKENQHEVDCFIKYWKEKKVNSISIANEFVYDDDVVINKFAESEKDYIGGMCTAFGNMSTLPNGETVWCCGMNPNRKETGRRLIVDGCETSINDAVSAMSDKNSDFRKMCSRCALYVPYSDTEIIDGWKVSRNSERETWIRIDK